MIKKTTCVALMSILVLAVLTSVACQSSVEPPAAPGVSAPAAAPDAKTAAPPATTEGKSAGHAASTVKPGSYEDWCGEHEVPESLCTRCNPSLIAAFKATGDWCDEHGLPESQCKICHPDLKIERPARTTSEG